MSSNSRFFFVLASAAASLGIGNLLFYPYLSFMYGGLFFLPYLAALAVLGIPLLLLEFSIGQHFNKNIVDLFGSIRKWFSGIGWLMIFNSFILMSAMAVMLSWSIIYFFVSFGLQWKSDAKYYFFSKVLQASDGIGDFTNFSLPVFIALALSCLIILFCIRKGFGSIKRTFLIAFPIFTALMIFFLLYSLSLDNALSGVYYFLKPSIKSLLSPSIWLSSFSLAVLSLGLSFGIMPAFARKNDKGFMLGSSFVIAIVEVIVSIAFAFIVFGFIGFLGINKGMNLNNLISSDFWMHFTVLAQALPLFNGPTLLSLLFFLFLSSFLVFGVLSLAYSISNVLVQKFNTKHINAAIIVSGLGFLFGLLFVIKPGFYIMDIVTHFIYYSIMIALLLEVTAVGWFFDVDKLSEHINQASKLKIGGLWRFIIRYFAPLVLLSLLVIQAKSD
ncbi:MAG TPA: hypothetical protein HA360_05770, partial [Nanoarchaeota archaeon]|nr:hypothetical protein [Nanoarchaeota archaeon]